MFGIIEGGKILSLDVMESYRCIKFNEFLSAPNPMLDSRFVRYHFVETTNGELIMLSRYHEAATIACKLYKSMVNSHDSSAEQFEIVPIKNLGGDSLFLIENRPTISVSASLSKKKNQFQHQIMALHVFQIQSIMVVNNYVTIISRYLK